jgi:serine protease DegQ
MKKTSILAGIFILLAANTFSQTVSDMLERSLSSVVTVAVYRIQENKEVLGYRGAPKGSDVAYEKTLDLSEALTKGSGFVINRNGKYYVITNAHVVESASEEPGSIYVYTISRGKDEVRIVGGDSFYDVAVLEFVTNPDSDVTYLDFKKEEPRIGETVYAIGNPLGEYPYTVTNGIISAKNRVREGITGKFGFLQTTATIIWGNSGGPLLDMNGKVAGINSQIAFAKAPNGEEIIQSQINFALEAAIAERIINDVLTNNGRVNRAFLGLEISQKFSMSYDWYSGNSIYQEDSLPVITGVIPGSPAYSLMANKIGAEILKINGVAVRNVEEALGELEKVKPQSPVKLTVLKNGLREEVTIVPSALRSEEF